MTENQKEVSAPDENAGFAARIARGLSMDLRKRKIYETDSKAVDASIAVVGTLAFTALWNLAGHPSVSEDWKLWVGTVLFASGVFLSGLVKREFDLFGSADTVGYSFLFGFILGSWSYGSLWFLATVPALLWIFVGAPIRMTRLKRNKERIVEALSSVNGDTWKLDDDFNPEIGVGTPATARGESGFASLTRQMPMIPVLFATPFAALAAVAFQRFN